MLPSRVPPVRPPEGWRCKMESWAVVKPPGPADMEGWQYAFSKYKSDIMWGCTSIGRRWQRRLWRCTLVEARKGAKVVAANMQRRATLEVANHVCISVSKSCILSLRVGPPTKSSSSSTHRPHWPWSLLCVDAVALAKTFSSSSVAVELRELIPLAFSHASGETGFVVPDTCGYAHSRG